MTLLKLISALALLLGLAACGTTAPTPPTPTSGADVAVSVTPTSSSTSVPPSPTTEPAATETEVVVALEPTETATATASATATSAPSATATVPPATATATVAASVTPGGPERPDEVILILEPGPGSRVVNSVRVAGEADGTFEQNLVVRLVTADGTELALEPTTIQADLGQRGPFEIEIPFTVSGEEQAFIQVLSESPRDGGITHLSSVGVTIANSGAETIVPVTPGPEQIAIFEPAPGDVIRGGVVHIEGFALASFEQTLDAYVLDADGNFLGRQSITVDAPDLGQPGPFSADIPYRTSSAGPARIVVRDPSAAFEGTAHLSSVEVMLGP